MDTSSTPRSAAPTEHPSPSDRRLDIQGLRGVAVLLVLAYHAGIPGIGGGFVGVDVFFVISGFLITGLILREVDSTGRLDLSRFWARRIRRLLPASAVVLLSTVILMVLALPATRWQAVLGDIGAAALYVVNWRLAATSTDYLASDEAASPVQHFWSLAVEEQFYLLWPVLVLLCLLVCRILHRPLRQTLAVALTVIALPSLIWSVWHTSQNPGAAYFVTTTRLWELAAGSLLALVARRLGGLRGSVAVALGWAGAGAVVGAGLLFSSSTPFPGIAAALPVLGTAAILAAGTADRGRGVGRLLSWRPLTQVGDLSYSLYLWHWPLVVVGTAVFADGDGGLWWVTGVLLVCTAVVPAWFTYTVIERPLHHSSPLLRRRFAALALAVCALLPLGTATAVQRSLQTEVSSAPTEPAARLPKVGAVLLAPNPRTSPAGEVPDTLGSPEPSLLTVKEDNPDSYAQGCHVDEDTVEPRACSYGSPGAPTKVALVGDSHAASWQPTLRWLAEQRGWQLDVYTKSACGWFDVEVAGGSSPGAYTECSEWNTRLQQRLTSDGYDMVVTTSDNLYTVLDEDGAASGSAAEDELVESYARVWRAVETAGVDVVALANTPRMNRDVPDCLGRYEDPSRCTTERDDALEVAGTIQADAAALVPAVNLIDLNEWICPREECSPVIGGAIVWRDSHHLTATYARSLALAMAGGLDAVGKPA